MREQFAAPRDGPPVSVDWTPPDLTPGRSWHAARVTNLFRAARDTCEDPEKWRQLVNKGLDDLTVHRWNYSEEGAAPEWLKVLWWEFPKEHWEALREGSDMNFLRPPDPGIHDNVVEDGRCGKTSPLLRPFPPLRMQHVQSTWWCAFNWHHIRSSKSQK